MQEGELSWVEEWFLGGLCEEKNRWSKPPGEVQLLYNIMSFTPKTERLLHKVVMCGRDF